MFLLNTNISDEIVLLKKSPGIQTNAKSIHTGQLGSHDRSPRTAPPDFVTIYIRVCSFVFKPYCAIFLHSPSEFIIMCNYFIFFFNAIVILTYIYRYNILYICKYFVFTIYT